MQRTAATTKTPLQRVSVVSPDETAHDKFVRLGNDRTKKAIKAIRRIGLLGSPAYERTSVEIEKIRQALQKTVDETIIRLKGRQVDEIEDIL